ncbi:MAG: PilT/PilU family type 4a pilus ATPase [Acidobacteria bacterium]|nr:PilT/PilU family type 4a pilus ATPase [Acidobacteriota bacterium]
MAQFDPQLENLVREMNVGSATAPKRAKAGDPLMTPSTGPGAFEGLDEVLKYAVDRGASDILMTDGSGLTLRLQGGLVTSEKPVLKDGTIRALVAPLLTETYRQDLENNFTVDFGFVRQGIGRFRANLHFQRGTLGVALRVLPKEVPTVESLGLPRQLGSLADRKKGLILVTGSAGSGKSTTLAALIGLINERHAHHIVTIEDPIEYRHANQKSVVEQIEVGRDTRSFASALRSILRQSPDVILVGEIRDSETMSAAITAAETGHLVLATLHTNDAIRAIGRVVDGFPSDQQNQIRQQLSLGLIAVVAQQLIPSADGRRRHLAVEVLMGNNAVSNLIRRGEDHMLRSQLSLGKAEGMVMMEESLAGLVKQGLISADAAAAHCLRPDELRRYLNG